MKIKNKFLKVLVWIILILLVISIFVAILGYLYLNFYIVPKINENTPEISDKITVSDIAKELNDKQIIDNIINFDKDSVSYILSAVTELETEFEQENPTTDSKTENNETVQEIQKEGTTAYQRIMNEATKDEISLGTSILSKVSMAKVNELRKSGDTAALKAYIKSVLSPSEISEALKLYNKYKHLL